MNKNDCMKVWNAGNGWSISFNNGSIGTSSGDTFRRFAINVFGSYFHNDNSMQWCTSWCYRLLYGWLILLFPSFWTAISGTYIPDSGCGLLVAWMDKDHSSHEKTKSKFFIAKLISVGNLLRFILIFLRNSILLVEFLFNIFSLFSFCSMHSLTKIQICHWLYFQNPVYRWQKRELYGIKFLKKVLPTRWSIFIVDSVSL